MTTLLDLRYAIRSLSRSWGFSALVVVTLGLGIGANTAVFSALRGVLLRPLPHRSGGELVYLRQSAELTGENNVRFSVPEVIDYRDGATLLTGFAEFSAMTFNMIGHTEPVQVTTGIVTGNYFDVLGLGAIAGRTFDAREDGPAAEPAMVLTHEYWMRMFGGAPDVVGRRVRVNGQALAIVGVLQPAPHYPQRTDVFVNMVTSPHHLSATMVQGRTHRMTEVFARLTAGTNVAQANAELAGITSRVHDDHPDAYETGAGYQVVATPLREVLTGEARLTLQLLMATTLLVLLIALANVANLMLMRLVGREQELAVRWSLGAGAWRLRRLLLMESGLLAVAGAGLGLLLAWPAVGLLVRLAERLTPRAAEIRVDGAVLGFTVVVALAVACALAFAPSLGRLRTLGTSAALKDGRATPGGSRRRAQRGLVVAQLAVTAVVLTTAGLLARTLLQLQAVDPGLEPEGVLTMEVPIEGAGRSPGDVLTLYEEMRRRMAALPGVVGVALGSNVPLRSSDFMLDVAVDDRPLRPGEPTPRAEYRTASPEYFEVAGIPLLRGRAFVSTDRGETERVAILTQSLADRLFPDRDPIGRRVAWTGDVLRFIPVSGRLAHRRRCRWRHPRRRARRRAQSGGVSTVRAGGVHRRGAHPHPFGSWRAGTRGGRRHPRARSRPADRERDDSGRRAAATGRVPAAQRAAAHLLRRAGAADRRCRRRWHAGLFGSAPHRGDRYPDEPRRRYRPGAAPDPRRRRCARGVGARGRRRRVAARGPAAGRPAVRGATARSAHAGRRGRVDERSGSRRKRGARAPGRTGRPRTRHPRGLIGHATMTASKLDGELLAGEVKADVAGWLSPRIGGVGPMTRALLLANTVTAAERPREARRRFGVR